MIWFADAVQSRGSDAFVIKCEYWFDARRIAMMRFDVGPDEVVLEVVDVLSVYAGAGMIPDVELKWQGSDYTENGGRALYWRAPAKGDDEWKTMESFR